MQHAKELQVFLKSYFNFSFWNTDCLSHFIFALEITNSVNLMNIAKSFPGVATTESCYRRLQRFITRLEISFSSLWGFTNAIFDLPEKIDLCMDRTNWKFGKVHINFLVITLAYKGVGIPIIWSLLPERKRGNSNALDRQKLFEKLLKFIPVERIKSILCDREFIDGDWIAYLSSKKIKFIIRSKDNILASGNLLRNSFLDLKVGEAIFLEKTKCIVGCDLYAAGLRLPTGEILIVVSRHYDLNLLDDYKIRWQIESFFSALKTRGFNFESTHITDMEKLSKLMFVVSIALLWSYRSGEILEEITPTRIKKHGFKAKSLIKVGSEAISKALARMVNTKKYICNIIKAVFDSGLTMNQRKNLISVV